MRSQTNPVLVSVLAARWVDGWKLKNVRLINRKFTQERGPKGASPDRHWSIA